MCDCAEKLADLKKFQIKLEPIQCTCTSLCWCNELTFRFPMEQIQDECMSPQEILDSFGSDMTERDRKYLKGLLDREFIPN